MEKRDLCKVSIGQVIYRVRAYVCEDESVHHYAVMCERNIAKGGNWFKDYRQAVMFMLRVAFNDVAQLSLEGLQ